MSALGRESVLLTPAAILLLCTAGPALTRPLVFKIVATVGAKDRPEGRVKTFSAEGRYLRVKAANGPIPQWHY